MIQEYEKPSIVRLKSGFMNKFGASGSSEDCVREQIDGIAIDDLVRKFGSPLFVFSEKRLRRRARQLHDAFATRYPNVVCSWSYKTNYLKAICAILHQEGAIAEVVSEMEFDKARGLGVPGEQIVFNGPHKPRPALEQALADGAMVNVDHLDELDDLERIAGELGRPLPVGIRLNLDAGIQPQWSRFGFNLESGQAADVVSRIRQRGKLDLAGLHCHLGTFVLDPTAYARQVEKMVAFAYEVQDRFGFRIDYLDLGGGFPSRNRLKGTYLSPDVGVPPIDEYAEEICDALHRALRPGDFPRVILESGRAVVDDAGYMVTSVVASKFLADGTRAYVVDAGVNLLFTTFWYRLNIETERQYSETKETSVLYGPLCMNIDVIDEGVLLPPLARGDRLILSPVGAYNATQWMQFIQYRPNVVLISEDGAIDVIREREQLSDIEERERLPDRLQAVSAP